MFIFLLLLLATASGGDAAAPPPLASCFTETELVGEVAQAGDSSLTAPDAVALGVFVLLLLLATASGAGDAAAVPPPLHNCTTETDADVDAAQAGDSSMIPVAPDAAALGVFFLLLLLATASGGDAAAPPPSFLAETELAEEATQAGDSSLIAPDAAALGVFFLLLLLATASGGDAAALPALASCLTGTDVDVADAPAAGEKSDSHLDPRPLLTVCTVDAAVNANSGALTK